MNDIQKNVIIIVGMHRSGTSLLAGCLHLLGVNFRKRPGYSHAVLNSEQFENFDITLVHDMLLRDLGCRWDIIGNLPDGWLDSEAAQVAEQKLISLIGRDLADNEVWSVKDPRICRLMPLWQRVLSRMEIRPHFIVLVRHPFEVARSLQEKNRFDILKGHLLWMTHYRDALNACMDYPHVMVTYDQLLADPLTTLQRIARILNVSYPNNIEERYPSIVDYVRPELKHHQIGNYAEAAGFSQYDWIYQQFRLAQVQAIDYHPVNNSDFNALNFSDRNLSSLQLSVFPLVSSTRTLSDFKFERNHATAMFNNLLGIIGRYERADISDSIQRERALLAAGQSGADLLFAQVFFPLSGVSEKSYSETNSQKILLAPDEWQKISVEIPQPLSLKSGRLRFDPMNAIGMAAISSIRILNSATGQIVWKVDDSDSFQKCDVQGDAFSLSCQNGLELLCSGYDARLIFPEITDPPDHPLSLEIWIKVSSSLAAFREKWDGMVHDSIEKTKTLNALNRKLSLLEEAKERLEHETSEQRKELESRGRELEARGKELEEARRGYQEELERKGSELTVLEEAKERLEHETSEQRKELESRGRELEARGKELEEARRGYQEELERKGSELTVLEEAKERLEHETSEQRKELESRGRELEARGKELEEARRGYQEELERKGSELTVLEEAKERLEHETSEQRKELESRGRELEARGKELEEARRGYQEELERKGSELTVLEEAKERLEHETSEQRRELEQKLCKQESLTREYFAALMNAEKKQADQQERIDNLSHLAQERMRMIGELDKQFHESAARMDEQIKTVNADCSNDVDRLSREMEQERRQKEAQIRSIIQEKEQQLRQNENQIKSVMSEIDRIRNQKEAQIQDLDSELTNIRIQRKQDKEIEWLEHAYYLNNRQLCKWLAQIENDYLLLKKSFRWKTGNFIVRFFEICLFRKDHSMPADRLEHLFHERRSWLPKFGNGKQDQQFLTTLMRQAKSDVEALISSMRWRIGNRLVSFLDRLLFRGELPMASDHMLLVFNEYASWADCEGGSSRID